jgi:hypothetical protein
MPTYAPSWEQTSPSPPLCTWGGGDFDTQGECGSRSSCSPGGVGAATDTSTACSFLMISPNLHDIWPILF